MPHDLLPPNRMPLETALADIAPRLLLERLADAPRQLKSNPPDSILPWLASEWFLSGFIKYFPTLQDLIDAGLPWLMERGTAAAVERVLSWIDMPMEVIEEDGARLQLDPGRVVTPDELHDLVYLVGASIPAHVDLYRLYHEYDLRCIGVSQTAALDEGLLSDDSGVWVTVGDDKIKLSFGHRISRWIDATGHAVWLVRRDSEFGRTWYEDRARLSVWSLDSEIVPNRKVIQGQLIGLITRPIADPPALGRHLNIARSALDLDGDLDPFGDLNCGFAGGADIEYRPFVLSDSRLSDHDNDVRHIFIDERFDDPRRRAFPPLEPQPRYGVMPHAEWHSALTRRGGAGSIWTGAWDKRRWYDESIRFSTTITETI
jgi:hypothetical protein